MNVYVLVVSEFMESCILGIFSKKEDAEKQKFRIEKIIKDQALFSMAKYTIVECPFNSTELIDEGLRQFEEN